MFDGSVCLTEILLAKVWPVYCLVYLGIWVSWRFWICLKTISTGLSRILSEESALSENCKNPTHSLFVWHRWKQVSVWWQWFHQLCHTGCGHSSNCSNFISIFDWRCKLISLRTTSIIICMDLKFPIANFRNLGYNKLSGELPFFSSKSLDNLEML